VPSAENFERLDTENLAYADGVLVFALVPLVLQKPGAFAFIADDA
jgi:hypothetical protein